jgi:hypothetical protein
MTSGESYPSDAQMEKALEQGRELQKEMSDNLRPGKTAYVRVVISDGQRAETNESFSARLDDAEAFAKLRGSVDAILAEAGGAEAGGG